MASLEFNKFAAAVLTAAVIAMFSGFIAELLTHTPGLEENVYVVATAEPVEDGKPAAPTGPEPVLPLLASADPAAGETAARKCTACHTFDQGGANRIGPNLYGVVGRDIAGVSGFSFSAALQDMEGDWSYEALNHFVADPKGFAPGTKMSFAGVRRVEERADLIAYLRGLSDSPMPLPTEEEIQAVQETAEETAEGASEAADEAGEAAQDEADDAQQAAADASGLGPLLAAADPEAGARVARKCTACHTFEQGGPNKIGPNLYGVIGGPVAHRDDYNYSQALQDMADETWTYEKLSSYIESPRDFAPGNKMVFAGLKKPEERAALIAYLRTFSDDPPPLPE
ncbi:MAG: c-type cytochrome [Kiloniellales bacterium]